jgi:hypothetical protein
MTMNVKRRILAGALLLLTCVLGASAARADGWTDMIKVYGDLRYRLESFQAENNSGVYAYRERQRVRARIGTRAQIDDYWLADFRLAASEAGFAGGNGDPVSTNQTMGDLETRKPIWVDLAYIEYKVLFDKGKLIAGKQSNPFVTVSRSQLIWDTDISPEGGAGKFQMDVMPDLNLYLNAGGFWLRESSTGWDPMIYGAQAGVKTKVEDIKVEAGFSYYLYQDITNQYAYDFTVAGTAGSNTATARSYGNTLVNGKYANNYMLGNPYVMLDITPYTFDVPVSLYADYVLNNGAVSYNRGWMAGFVVNKAKAEGSWQLGYCYRFLEKDAVVGQFSDSDFGGGGTDAQGHLVQASYVPADGVQINLSFFRNQRTISTAINPFYNRFQGDLALSF